MSSKNYHHYGDDQFTKKPPPPQHDYGDEEGSEEGEYVEMTSERLELVRKMTNLASEMDIKIL